jgi:hypothetical protein
MLMLQMKKDTGQPGGKIPWDSTRPASLVSWFLMLLLS